MLSNPRNRSFMGTVTASASLAGRRVRGCEGLRPLPDGCHASTLPGIVSQDAACQPRSRPYERLRRCRQHPVLGRARAPGRSPGRTRTRSSHPGRPVVLPERRLRHHEPVDRGHQIDGHVGWPRWSPGLVADPAIGRHHSRTCHISPRRLCSCNQNRGPGSTTTILTATASFDKICSNCPQAGPRQEHRLTGCPYHS